MESQKAKKESVRTSLKLVSSDAENRERQNAEMLEELEFERHMMTSSSHADESEGNWLVSYADMMTLLVGFFVMLFSFSKVDSGEFEKVKKETTKIFGGEYKVPFEKLSSSLRQVVEHQKLTDQVLIQENDGGIQITFRGALFFDSGVAELRDQAKDLLEKLVPTITSNSKDLGIVIEGHTDNRPMSSKVFTSNWELSSVRACTVLRFFLEKSFNPDRIKAIGWGERRPILPNSDKDGTALPDNQSQNRRVVIKILKDFD